MYDTLATVLKYLFTLIIYLFIFGIMRLIYLDISSINAQKIRSKTDAPYLKLINQREKLDFKVHETYSLYAETDEKNKEVITIGRENKNEIVIKDAFISGRHAQFVLHDNKVFLKDLGSTNGTLVNGESINDNEVCLENWDKILIGRVEFIFVS